MTSDQYRVRRPPARPRPPRVESSDEFLVRHGLLPSSERPPPGSNGRQGPPGRALPPPGRGAPPGWPAALGGPTTQRDERSWPDPPQRGVPGDGRRPEAYFPPNGTGARFREVPPAQPDGARRTNGFGDGERFDARTPVRRGRADGGAVAEPRRPRASRPADPAPPGGDHRPPSEPRNGAQGGRRRGDLRATPPVDAARRRTDLADGPDTVGPERPLPHGADAPRRGAEPRRREHRDGDRPGTGRTRGLPDGPPREGGRRPGTATGPTPPEPDEPAPPRSARAGADRVGVRRAPGQDLGHRAPGRRADTARTGRRPADDGGDPSAATAGARDELRPAARRRPTEPDVAEQPAAAGPRGRRRAPEPDADEQPTASDADATGRQGRRRAPEPDAEEQLVTGRRGRRRAPEPDTDEPAAPADADPPSRRGRRRAEDTGTRAVGTSGTGRSVARARADARTAKVPARSTTARDATTPADPRTNDTPMRGPAERVPPRRKARVDPEDAGERLRADRIDETLTRLTAAHAGLVLGLHDHDEDDYLDEGDEGDDLDEGPAPRRTGLAVRVGRYAVAALALLLVVVAGLGWVGRTRLDGALIQVAAVDVPPDGVLDAAAQTGDENVLVLATDSGGSAGATTRANTVTVLHRDARGDRTVAVTLPPGLEITRPPCERWDADGGRLQRPDRPRRAAHDLRQRLRRRRPALCDPGRPAGHRPGDHPVRRRRPRGDLGAGRGRRRGAGVRGATRPRLGARPGRHDRRNGPAQRRPRREPGAGGRRARRARGRRRARPAPAAGARGGARAGAVPERAAAPGPRERPAARAAHHGGVDRDRGGRPPRAVERARRRARRADRAAGQQPGQPGDARGRREGPVHRGAHRRPVAGRGSRPRTRQRRATSPRTSSTPPAATASPPRWRAPWAIWDSARRR